MNEIHRSVEYTEFCRVKFGRYQLLVKTYLFIKCKTWKFGTTDSFKTENSNCCRRYTEVYAC